MEVTGKQVLANKSLPCCFKNQPQWFFTSDGERLHTLLCTEWHVSGSRGQTSVTSYLSTSHGV